MKIEHVETPQEKLQLIPFLIGDAIAGIPTPELQAEALITLAALILCRYHYTPGKDPVINAIIEPVTTQLSAICAKHGTLAPSYREDRNVAEDDNDDTQAFNN